MMTPTEVKSLQQKLYDALNAGDFNAAERLISPTYIEHEMLLPGMSATRNGMIEFYRAIKQAFPDIHYEITDLLVEADRLATRVVVTGTQEGEFAGFPPSGRPVNFETVSISRIDQGMVLEHWGVADQLSLLQQLGAIPVTGGMPRKE